MSQWSYKRNVINEVFSLFFKKKNQNTHWHPPGGVVDLTVFFHGTWIEMRPQELKTGFLEAKWWKMEDVWQRITYPQCFMFCGLSIRIASLIFRSWSGHALVTVILWSSDCLGLLGVGWRTTCAQKKKKKSQQTSETMLQVYPGSESFILSSTTFSNINWCVYKRWWLCVFVF